MKVYVVKIFYDDENGYEFWDENPCVHGIYTTLNLKRGTKYF